MAVTIIKDFKVNSPDGVCAIVDLDDLLLDDLNPRFGASLSFSNNQNVSQEWIINYLIENSDVVNLTKSINSVGGLYDEELISAFYNKEKKLVVLEGNRRTAACKILLNPNLVSEENKKQYSIEIVNIKAESNIKRVKVVIHGSRESAQTYITAKHTKPEVLKWSSTEKANYYYAEFKNGNDIKKIAESASDKVSSVRNSIKNFQIFNDIFIATKRKYPDLSVEQTSLLPISTKFFPALFGKANELSVQIGFNDNSLKYEPCPEYADTYHQMLVLSGEAFFVRDEAKTNAELSERSNNDKFRISTDEIKSSLAVCKLIDENKRIPGLKELITKYNQNNCDESPKSSEVINSQLNRDVIVSSDKTDTCGEEKNSQVNTSVTQETDSNKSDNSRFFSPNINSIKSGERYLRFTEQEARTFKINEDNDLCKKINRLIYELAIRNINSYPYTCCLLYRTLLESATYLVFQRFTSDTEYRKRDLAGIIGEANSDILFLGVSDRLLKQRQVNINARVVLEKLIVTLNNYIHSETSVDTDLVASSWATMKYYIIACLSKGNA